MKIGEGIVLQEVTKTLKGLFASNPRLTIHHVLGALESLRYSITEETIKRSHPWLRPLNPLDKRAPHGLRSQQKRPSAEDHH